ncbi:fungal-specific transcription factor domain-containing protein [Cyathus striatus]|nr:fungal-specific transcription factor domain-containing protein [Cyathus striatus]
MPAARNSTSTHSIVNPVAARSKVKKRIPGACDFCKRKKVRCDSAVMPGNRCSNCIVAGNECTHDDVLKTMKNMREYVDVLEQRLKKMDEILNKAIPGLDLSTVGLEPFPEEAGDEDTPVARNDDELDGMSSRMNSLRLNPKQNYFSGKSSGHQLIQTALEVKDEYISVHGLPNKDRWLRKRLEFWEIPSWMTPHPETVEDFPVYIFPDSDLLVSLVDAYFIHINPYFPLLHRPTFERSIGDKEHLRDYLFGGTVMLVCALGSRFSNDSRAFVDGSGAASSAGWKWFCQVNALRKSLFKRTSLYELQLYALSIMYIQTTQVPDGVWVQIGIGLRLAQEVGAHRKRKTPCGRPNAENELWKRAFWVLLCLDRLISSYSGRPCCIQEDDIDLDLPVDCDDEYWDQGFMQPLGKPSKISFFIYYLKLMDILAYAMKAIYPIKRLNRTLGKALPEQKVIPDVDSTMNSWLNSIPIHLRWNPNCTDDLLLKQSAALHASYYDLQILVHRPFIPSPRRNPRPSAFPSLAICTNAAKLCCHVLESFHKLNTVLLPHLQATVMHAAIILLLNIWSGKKSGLSPNTQRELEDVQKCMKYLKSAEQRWCSAGRYYDVISELAFAGELSINVDSPSSAATTGSPTQHPTPSATPESAPYCEGDPPNTVFVQSTLQPQSNGPEYLLPVYSTELGSLPVYGQFDFKDVTFTANHTNQNSFSTPVTSPDQDNLNEDVPMDNSEFITNGSQNLFSAADDFVRNALFGGQVTRSNDTSFYFTSTSFPNPIGDVSDVNLVEYGDLSLLFGSTDEGNTSDVVEETTSAAACIFAAYDPTKVTLQNGGRFFF